MAHSVDDGGQRIDRDMKKRAGLLTAFCKMVVPRKKVGKCQKCQEVSEKLGGGEGGRPNR
jgi:hypothetical protein